MRAARDVEKMRLTCNGPMTIISVALRSQTMKNSSPLLLASALHAGASQGSRLSVAGASSIS
jgi:hypothetical protein